MLRLFRRHLDTCPERGRGRFWLKCTCPLHCDGMVAGERVRQSLNTVNLGRAGRRLIEIEDQITAQAAGGRVPKGLPGAVDAFLESRSKDVRASSLSRYRRTLRPLGEFAERRQRMSVDQVSLEDLDAYKGERKVSPLTWSKELETLRAFFRFCQERRWCADNPASKLRGPRNPQPTKPRQPYSQNEIIRIFAAAEAFGKTGYERARARAMLFLLRRYGLRISDVALLERERVRDDRLFLYAHKNGNAVWAPLWPDVKLALEALPLPAGAGPDCPYFFWTGLGDKYGHIKTVDRTLQAVFRKSGVEDASAHRFRHTLAVEVLVKGGTIEDAASILGDSPAIVRKHYLPWCRALQSRITEVLERVHGKVFVTPMARERFDSITPSESGYSLVLEEGVEPS